MTIDTTMTTKVSRVVSSRLGQTDFLNSVMVSCKKVIGLTLPTALVEMGLVLPVEALAIKVTSLLYGACEHGSGSSIFATLIAEYHCVYFFLSCNCALYSRHIAKL
jgi:hypothetical protein